MSSSRLVITAHWSDDPQALDVVCDALKELKVPGTAGVALLYAGEKAHEMYDTMLERHNEGVERRAA
jgi:hypothetical protein